MSEKERLLREANRFRVVAREAYEKAAELEKQYNSIVERDRRAAMTENDRALEDKARLAEGICGCICGCRRRISGGYVYAGNIHFGNCDSCDICS